MNIKYGKIASVIVTPSDEEGEKGGVFTADVFCDEEHGKKTVRFPCTKERIGGIYHLKRKGKIVSASFAEYFEELKRLKCEKIIFQDGAEMEV